MPVEPDEHERKREQATERILASRAARRVVVAGPGTGKSSLFKRAFADVQDRGLALTFIKVLRDELRDDLPRTVYVRTFDGQCLFLLKSIFESDFELYPFLPELIAEDLRRGHGARLGAEGLERLYSDLDETGGVLTRAVERSRYYGHLSFAGAVYEAVAQFAAEPERIPEYPLVVVDEFQDFTPLQVKLLDSLCKRSRALIAGDDDQALYSFRGASAKYIRELSDDVTVERFELPYCSRCTHVIVESVNDIVREARNRGRLAGRIDKTFECFMSDTTKSKKQDSAAHPELVHAVIEHEERDSDAMGKYIVEQIRAIPPEDLAESRDPEHPYPTVLITGPEPMLEWASRSVKAAFPHTEVRSARDKIEPIAGYALLDKDARSRLGWRILLRCFNDFDADSRLGEAVREQVELADIFSAAYKERHLALATLVGRAIRREKLSESEVEQLTLHFKRSPDEIRAVARRARSVRAADADSDPSFPISDEGENEQAVVAVPEGAPTIKCRTIVGSKGLSAGYVFVVGFNDRYLPRQPTNVRDDEVCGMIVALSRTRKECQLISCEDFAGQELASSTFLSWIHQPVREQRVKTPERRTE